MNSALILIDIQNDYFTGGLWPVEDMDRISATAQDILHSAQQAGRLVVHIRHEAASDTAPFFRPATKGAELHPCVLKQ